LGLNEQRHFVVIAIVVVAVVVVVLQLQFFFGILYLFGSAISSRSSGSVKCFGKAE